MYYLSLKRYTGKFNLFVLSVCLFLTFLQISQIEKPILNIKILISAQCIFSVNFWLIINFLRFTLFFGNGSFPNKRNEQILKYETINKLQNILQTKYFQSRIPKCIYGNNKLKLLYLSFLARFQAANFSILILFIKARK